MIKIVVVIGTRPEAIKMAPVVSELRNELNFADVVLLNTGQHRELLDGVLEIFGLHSNKNLNLMEPNQSLAEFTGRAIQKLSEYFSTTNPNLVVVHGDTSSALAAAMAAFYNRIPVAHVEAGLRTQDLNAPFPEEMNRQVIARISALAFAPTASAAANLRNEGLSMAKIVVTGNTAVDSISLINRQFLEPRDGADSLATRVSARKIGFDEKGKHVLVTLHRRENFGDKGAKLLEGIRTLAREQPDLKFIFPVHPNPTIKMQVENMLSKEANIFLCEPLNYVDFSFLLKFCRFAISDSGGVQEEAVTFAKQVLVARDSTERQEGLATGFLRLIGSDPSLLLEASREILNSQIETTSELNLASNPFGDGRAAERIAAEVRNFFAQ